MKGSTMQRPSLKLTIKLKGENTVDNSLTTDDHLNKVEGEPSASDSSNLPASLAINSEDKVDVSSAEGLENNHSAEDDENPSENSQYQLVLYDPTSNGAGETETIADAVAHQPPPFSRQHPSSNQTPSREWRPDISCDDPPDIVQDGSRLWAIDKPSIARPPPGWQRLLRFRGEGGTKFADVYYVAPSGKRLRSMVEIQKYLDEHPEYIEEGISLSQFSFQIPRPLKENYVRKRPHRVAPANDAGDHGIPGSFDPSEVRPITWVSPDVDTDLQLSGPGLSTNYSEDPGLKLETQSAKRKRTPSKRKSNGDLVNSQNEVNLEESHEL
ncbi:UNVERIFIED_CONTAM: Methyl-CpG-binding domain-containing protein 2 [Sesamum radiatum]|uniref:Methyl-CpG-binding domain-containing protein 2 n=1 Tax=Sesamum radiatum TaxID=300843 RepID=A0AAW2NMJ3_SESRA